MHLKGQPCTVRMRMRACVYYLIICRLGWRFGPARARDVAWRAGGCPQRAVASAASRAALLCVDVCAALSKILQCYATQHIHAHCTLEGYRSCRILQTPTAAAVQRTLRPPGPAARTGAEACVHTGERRHPRCAGRQALRGRQSRNDSTTLPVFCRLRTAQPAAGAPAAPQLRA